MKSENPNDCSTNKEALLSTVEGQKQQVEGKSIQIDCNSTIVQAIKEGLIQIQAQSLENQNKECPLNSIHNQTEQILIQEVHQNSTSQSVTQNISNNEICAQNNSNQDQMEIEDQSLLKVAQDQNYSNNYEKANGQSEKPQAQEVQKQQENNSLVDSNHSLTNSFDQKHIQESNSQEDGKQQTQQEQISQNNSQEKLNQTLQQAADLQQVNQNQTNLDQTAQENISMNQLQNQQKAINQNENQLNQQSQDNTSSQMITQQNQNLVSVQHQSNSSNSQNISQEVQNQEAAQAENIEQGVMQIEAQLLQIQNQNQIDQNKDLLALENEQELATQQLKTLSEEISKESLVDTALKARNIISKQNLNLKNLVDYFSIIVEQFQKQMTDFEFLNDLRSQVDKEKQNQMQLNENLMVLYNRYKMQLEELQQRFIEDCVKMWKDPSDKKGYQRAIEKANNQQILQQIKQKVDLSENNLSKINQILSQLDILIERRDFQSFKLTQQKVNDMMTRIQEIGFQQFSDYMKSIENYTLSFREFQIQNFFNLRSEEIRSNIAQMQNSKKQLIFEEPQSKTDNKQVVNNSKTDKINETQEEQSSQNESVGHQIGQRVQDVIKKMKLMEKKSNNQDQQNQKNLLEVKQFKNLDQTSSQGDKKLSKDKEDIEINQKLTNKNSKSKKNNEDSQDEQSHPHKIKSQDQNLKTLLKAAVKTNDDHANDILNIERGFEVDSKYLDKFNDQDMVQIANQVNQKMEQFLQKNEKQKNNETSSQYDVIAWHSLIQQIKLRKKLKQQKKLIKESEVFITKVCKKTNQWILQEIVEVDQQKKKALVKWFYWKKGPTWELLVSQLYRKIYPLQPFLNIYKHHTFNFTFFNSKLRQLQISAYLTKKLYIYYLKYFLKNKTKNYLVIQIKSVLKEK